MKQSRQSPLIYARKEKKKEGRKMKCRVKLKRSRDIISNLFFTRDKNNNDSS